MSGKSSNGKPRFAVGITGHRLNQLPENVHPVIEPAIGYALALIRAAAEEVHGAPVAPVLVSAIAEGADRFAAQQALRQRWRLETPLPFAIERYLDDFGEDATKVEFRAYLRRSKRVEVSPAADQPSPAPYAAVGRMIVDWSDALLAVWNGLAPKGPGGTAEVAALMLEKGAPVVWLPSQTGGPLQLVRADLKKKPTALEAALAARMAVIRQPAEMRVA